MTERRPAVHAEDLDSYSCGVPGCGCTRCRVVVLTATCHVERDGTMHVKYDRARGVLGLFCGRCSAHVADIAVARRESEASGGTDDEPSC